MSLDLVYRAMPLWPYPKTATRRGPGTFSATYPKTLRDLATELRALDVYDCELHIGVAPDAIRRDGQLRVVNNRIKVPVHPGVELRFTSKIGPQRYHTDACEVWRHNVRSIVLGLEALRAVERYGIGGAGEQYRGFVAELPESSSASTPTAERGWAIIAAQNGNVARALHATHPDNGGDPVDFTSVNLAREQRIHP